MLNLDTHVLIFMVQDELNHNERQKILSISDKLCISSIVLWEIAMLVKKNRIRFDFDSNEWKSLVSDLKILDIDEKIATQSTHLDFDSDPSDQLIAATSIIHNIPLLTRDKNILKSKLVPFA